MQVSKPFIIILLVSLVLPWSKAEAQDVVPLHASLHQASDLIQPMRELNVSFSTDSYKALIPDVFEGVRQNEISDAQNTLEPFFYKMRISRAGVCLDSIRVLHVGDSHIRGHFFTRSIERKLSSFFPSIIYDDFGINGAVAKTFVRPDRIETIKQRNPDLLILSFGTNESHNRMYNAHQHYAQLDELVSEIRKVLPDVPILLTTPPGSFERRGRRNFRINPRTEKAVDLIKEYARDNQLAFWDMYSIVGGKKYACENWSRAALLRPDHIHYLPEGYELQADIFCEAIMNAYNEYISF